MAERPMSDGVREYVLDIYVIREKLSLDFYCDNSSAAIQ